MQESTCSRGGAALLISGDSWKLLSNRKCSSEDIKKRWKTADIYSGLGVRDPIMDPNVVVHWRISSEEMMRYEEHHEVGTSICIPDWREYTALNPQRNTEHVSDWLTSSRSYFPLPRQFCLPTELSQQSSLTVLDPFIKGLSNQDNQTGPTVHVTDIFYWIKNFLNEATQHHTSAMETFERFIILSYKCLTTNKFCDIYPHQKLSTFIEYTGSSGSDDMMSIKMSGNAQRSFSFNTSYEDTDRGDLKTCSPKSKQESHRNVEHPQRPQRRSETEKMKMKKSVSFEEDVIVYVFDQETPTIQLHSEPCTPVPFNFPHNLPDVSIDNGLQWEDDFSVLECVGQSSSVSVPTNSWTSWPRPERCSPSQMCLFLTYVTESDLEL